MPSTLHETLTEMFRRRPSFAAEVLGVLGVHLPAHEHVRLESAEFTDVAPTEYRADAVVVLLAADRPVLAVVVEVQLHRKADKRYSWPVYLTTLRARLRCPAAVLVICVDAPTAAWSGAQIELGPGSWMTPLVLGPDRVPVVSDVIAAAEAPELAVLSAMTHGAGPDRRTVLESLLSALASLDGERASLYSDLVFAALPAAARRYLEELMSSGLHEYQSEFVRKYIFQGRAEGRVEGRAESRAEDVLAVLDARDVPVSDDARARITGCADLDLLGVWLRRAVRVESVEELFD